MANRVCKFYARGACLKGDQCAFVHEKKDEDSGHVCCFHRKGVCAFGSRCKYKHVRASDGSSSSNRRRSPLPKCLLNAKETSWVPKGSKSSSSDNCARSSQHKNLLSPGNDVGSSSSAARSEILFCSFAAADCPLGINCSRVHGNRCLYCREFCLHPTDREKKENHLRTCEKKEKYLQALNDSREVECNVCLERVLSKAKPSDCKFGLLPECDHAFCLSCIRNWRSSAPTSGMDMGSSSGTANAVRTCPVCRKLSYFVIPSGIWYSTKEEKQEIIDNYKANCKLINCKHFNFGNGNCPFGASCFYKHTVKPGSYTWIHGRPPPHRRQNNLTMNDMNDMLEMLSDVDLTNSIMRDSGFFDGMDPFGMMDISDSLGGESGPCFGPFDSDEDTDFFQMAALSEALVSGVDDFGPEDFVDEEFNPMEAALLSMMMHSNIDDDDDEEEYSDEFY